MSPDRPHITDAQRRARLVARQRLDVTTAATDVVELADAVVALHATTPSTVYLSAWARMAQFSPAELETALYESRRLVKALSMRRTLFVMSRPVLADAMATTAERVSAGERRNMLRDLHRSPDFDDPDGWIDAARGAVLAELTGAGEQLSSTQLRQRIPLLDRSIIYKPEKSYGGRMAMGARVLNMMSAAGDIVRGPSDAPWHQSKPRWAATADWLGVPLADISAHRGHLAMIRRWLAAFGPGTETDLVWWLGSTKTAVRAALAELDVEEVLLGDPADARVGYVLAGDTADIELPAPQAALLPELDPTTMGYKERDFYLGAHAPALFDRNGNGAATAWWDGRIVGGWYQTEDAVVRLHLLDDVPATGRRALADKAAELTDWLGGVRIRPGYPAPVLAATR